MSTIAELPTWMQREIIVLAVPFPSESAMPAADSEFPPEQ